MAHLSTAVARLPSDDPAAAAARRAMLFVAAILGLVFLRSPGTDDVNSFWVPYMESGQHYGLTEGYRTVVADYPPLSYVILQGAESVCAATGISTFIGLKVCLLLFYGLSIGIFQACWKELAPLALFIGTVLLSSVLLGYVDILYAPTMLLALWALGRRRIALFSALYAVSCLIKWQPLIFAPFVFWHALRPAADGSGVAGDTLARRCVRLAVPGGLITLVVILVFGWRMLDTFLLALANPGLSGTALNINWAWTYVLHQWDPATFGPLVDGEALAPSAEPLHWWILLPKAVFAVVYLLTLWRYGREENSFRHLLRAALLGYLAYCFFNTGVHENHLFIAAILACILASVDARETARAIIVVTMAGLNLVIFYGFSGSGLAFSRVIGIDATFVLSLLYVGIFLGWWAAWQRDVRAVTESIRQRIV